MAVAPTLYVATLVPTAARPARDRAFYVPYKSSEWELVGYDTRSAIQGTPSPTTRQYTSVPSVLHCNVEEYGRRKQRTPVSYDIEVLKVAATCSPTTQCSTIGDAELNDPVRNGKGWDLSAITTLINVEG